MDQSKLLRTLTIGQGSLLIPHIDAYHARGKFPDDRIIRLSSKKEEREYGEAKIRFSAGQDALASPRDLYLKHTDKLIPQPIGPTLRRSFDVGEFWHQYYALCLLDMNFIQEEGVERYIIHPINTEHGIAYGSGRGDLVGVNIPGHGSWLVDVKTMHKQAFEAGLPQYLYDKYEAQVNLYGDWFGYDKLMILGVEKDHPHLLREWILEPNPELVANIYDKWGYVAKCIREETEPE